MTTVQSDEMLVKAQILQIVLQCYCHSKCTKAGKNIYRNPAKRKKEEYLILSSQFINIRSRILFFRFSHINTLLKSS